MPTENYIPLSFIKNVALEIHPSYKLDNTPFSDEINDGDTRFIGRKQSKAKFVDFLKSPKKKGVFLVTGYRGMGKTSFVNRVIAEYRFYKQPDSVSAPPAKQTLLHKYNLFKNLRGKKHQRFRSNGSSSKHCCSDIPESQDTIKSIHITLAQSKPREIDILRLMAVSSADKFKEYLDQNNCDESKHVQDDLSENKRRLTISLIVLLIPLFVIWKPGLLLDFLSNTVFHFGLTSQWGLDAIKLVTILVLIITLIVFALSIREYIKLKQKDRILKEDNSAQNRINSLVERCNAAVSQEIGHDDEIKLEGISTKLFGGSEKKTKQYAIADTKEIEYELQQFLTRAKDECKLEFIYVFDELDKVDPAISTSYYYDDLENFEQSKAESAYQRDLRDRKQAIINIIAGLKNFLTTADARFIFIAGREMFDASLADIADRQSSLSSIFTYVFYIESLLKENNSCFAPSLNKEENISKENKILSPADELNNVNNSSLTTAIEEFLKLVLFGTVKSSLFKEAARIYEGENFGKIYFILQNFITYLAYRSNGSPKKIIKGIQDFIWVTDELIDPQKTIIGWQPSTVESDERKYLYFNYHNQYRIGFINYLYRPYLIQYGRNSKLYSDNIILSTPYLFDHLLKFHPFAFSLSNLELLPEVLSTNKTPSLKKHILQIIDFLGANHIRKTDIGLFDYKFYSRTLNEIAFLSKISEQESAAFNFTLDESYLVKLHIRSKIKELRSIYSKFLGNSESSTRQIFSIAHLNGSLGDLHFFDQEYDDAIVSYSDAIRPISQLEVSTMNMRDFITLIRNKLKLGLCFEKISSYEEALAFYSDASQDAKRFMVSRLRDAREIDCSPAPGNRNALDQENYHMSSLNDLLQIINQSFVAKIIIQEKMGLEGIRNQKMGIAFGGFLRFVSAIEEHSSRNRLITTNFFLMLGKVFYFKNSITSDKKESEYGKLPKSVAHNLQALITKYNEHFIDNKKKKEVKRKPTMALYMYILGLEELMQCRNDHFQLIQHILYSPGKNIAEPIIRKFTELIGKKDERYTAIHYRYMATLISCIGDCLFGIYYRRPSEERNSEGDVKQEENQQENKYHSYPVNSIFKSTTVNSTSSGLDFINAIVDTNSSSFSLGDIFKCYYISGQLFLRYGRSVSGSFQYRKILSILRMVIKKDETDEKDEKDEKDKTNGKPFLDFIRITLINPILEIISQNGQHTDRHMINKATSNFRKEDQNQSDHGLPLYYVLNNISNHPESREAILFYNYISIKLGSVPSESAIKTLVNSNNSFSTQYSRIFELDLLSKYRYEQIKTKLNTVEAVWSSGDCTLAVDYIFSMLSILRILKIYGTDYMLSFSFFAYTHYRVATFLRMTEEHRYEDKNETKPILEQITLNMEALFGKGGYSSLDAGYHFLMAKDLYGKAIQLHTAGTEYKKAIGQMIYLEDDFNDNAYHFGAAFDRYMMVHEVFSNKIKECDKEIASLNLFEASSYWSDTIASEAPGEAASL